MFGVLKERNRCGMDSCAQPGCIALPVDLELAGCAPRH